MLEFLVRKPTEVGDGSPVLVLLHGRGSHMGDLQGLAGVLPSRATLVTPQAPHPGAPWGYGPGWAWYRYLGEDRVDPTDLTASLAALDTFLAMLPGLVGFDPGSLILGGFSQGGSTSLAYALTRRGTAAGVVVLSGFLTNEGILGEGPEALRETPVFWGHGTDDPAVPYELAVKGRSRLREAGVDLTARDYPMGHQVSPEEMADLNEWLAGVLATGTDADPGIS